MSAKSIWTPANIVTCIRVALVPLWLLAAEFAASPPNQGLSLGSLAVALFYVLLALTDKLDGHLARIRGEETVFGQFLDPIADKLVVVVSLCYLLEIGVVSPWVLLIVVAREFLVSGLRMVVAADGEVIAASSLGKWKTAMTMVSISGLLMCCALPEGDPADMLGLLFQVLLGVAMLLTVWSGADYFMRSWHVIERGG